MFLNLQPTHAQRPTRRAARRQAVTAVEFAFVAPVMFMLLLGIIEIGRGLMLVHMLTNAARAGCRIGVVEGKTYNDVVAGVNSALTPIGIQSDTVTVQVNDTTTTTLGNVQASDELTITVSVPLSAVSWVPFPQYLPANLTGQYTLRRE